MFVFGVPALIGVLALPAGQPLAAQPGNVAVLNPAAAFQFAPAAVATHSTKGVVKSIDEHTLVITRSARHGKEMTFVLDASTHREGSVTVGTMVEVRYRTKASRSVAAVVSAEDFKGQR